MPWFHCNPRRNRPPLICRFGSAAVLFVAGCASPGPPRAPSLGLPRPVRDLAVTRVDNTVQLRFDAPSRSTDKVLLRSGQVKGQLCRQLERQPCIVISPFRRSIATTTADGKPNPIIWIDTLPPDLVTGSPRLLGYRVEFFSRNGRSAGPSAPAFTAAGAPPAPVEGLHAEGSRRGVILAWSSSSHPGDVVLRREKLLPARPLQHANPTSKSAHATASATVWLGSQGFNGPAGSGAQGNRMLDATALPGTSYRYSAQRRISVQLGGLSVDLRSSLSAPITFVLREIYPPPEPTGLTAAGDLANASPKPGAAPSSFAVDLIWQPVDDAGLLAGLAGYNIYREPLSGDAAGPRIRLNTTPAPAPSFHDTTASPVQRYRYSVTAVDVKGNESPAATAVLEPSIAR